MNPVLKTLLVLAASGVLFLGGFSFKDLRAGRLPGSSAFAQAVPVTNKAAVKKTPTQIFSEEFTRISNQYAGDSDPKSLATAGFQGMMNALGDPHSIFMEPVFAREFEDSTQGRQFFGGIGARLSPDLLGVKVIQVFKGSPAIQAGIRTGDVIIGVNGEDVQGKDVDEIVGKIKGEIGTSVKLLVLRNGKDKVNFELKRDKIIPPSADANVIENTNVGYVLVTGFEAPTPRQFAEAIQELEDKKIEGLVIDLRNNPGGLLESAARMLSLFIDYKPVVTVISRGDVKEVVNSTGGIAKTFKYPVTILLNEQSASAAEIFAGVLRDYKLATLVGEHTYGKASVQNVIPLVDGSSVKITVAHYKLPNGDDISRKQDEDGVYLSGGIKPDVEVPLQLNSDVSYGDPKTDNQLKKAIEIIQQKNPKAKLLSLGIQGGAQRIPYEIQGEYRQAEDQARPENHHWVG